MVSRRNFLLSGTVVVGAGLLRPACAFAAESAYLSNIGLQLYTVRNQLAKDEDATLKAVANAGYKQVELMSIAGDGPRIAKKARDLGMQVTSGFCDFRTFTTDDGDGAATVDELLKQATDLQLKHVVFGYIPKGSRETTEQYLNMAQRCNAAAKKYRDAGIQLCYHNHSFEFAPLKGTKKTGFECFVESFAPEMMFELDVFWAKLGGLDPISTLRTLSGRVSQVHLKDLKAGVSTEWDEGRVAHEAFQELGDGVIPMAEVLKVASETGVQQCHVEQDQSPAPLDSIVQSLKHLQA